MTTTNAELIAAFRAETMPTHDAEAGMAYFEHAEALADALESATTVTDERVQRVREACYAQGMNYPTSTARTLSTLSLPP